MNVILVPLLKILLNITHIYMYVVLVYVIMSWLVNFNIINTNQPFVSMLNNFLYAITEPILQRIRRIVPSFSGIDISAAVLILILLFIGYMLDELAFVIRT